MNLDMLINNRDYFSCLWTYLQVLAYLYEVKHEKVFLLALEILLRYLDLEARNP